MEGGEEEIPKRYWYEFKDRFSRLDELLVTLIKDLRILIKKIPVPPEIPEIPPLGVVDIGDVSVKALAQAIAARLLQLPNRVDDAEIDTSSTDWVSLKKTGKMKPSVAVGFHIEDVGGDFTYKIVRRGFNSPEKTAVQNDKFDFEFDDIMVKGSGTAGTGKIWIYWREPIVFEG